MVKVLLSVLFRLSQSFMSFISCVKQILLVLAPECFTSFLQELQSMNIVPRLKLTQAWPRFYSEKEGQVLHSQEYMTPKYLNIFLILLRNSVFGKKRKDQHWAPRGVCRGKFRGLIAVIMVVKLGLVMWHCIFIFICSTSFVWFRGIKFIQRLKSREVQAPG